MIHFSYEVAVQKVFTHENIAIVGTMRSYLEEKAIACELRNEFSSGVVGDIPFFDAWPELWVANEDYPLALELISEVQQKASSGADWLCHHCKESNPANFEVCWQCSSSK